MQFQLSNWLLPAIVGSGLSGLYSAIYGLEFDMFAQLLTFDPHPQPQPPTQMHSGTSEHLEEFLQIDTSTINTVFQRPFMIERRRYYSMLLFILRIHHNIIDVKIIEEHCKLSISTTGPALVVAAMV